MISRKLEETLFTTDSSTDLDFDQMEKQFAQLNQTLLADDNEVIEKKEDKSE